MNVLYVTSIHSTSIQTERMKFLCGVAGCTYTEMRKILKILNLNVKTQNYRNSCLQNLQRTEDYQISKQVSQCHPQGKRNIGRT
jgi:hypothetical protein